MHETSETDRGAVRVAVTGLRGIPATWGGIEHHCEQLYTRLAERGYAITVYGRSGYVPKHLTSYRGIRIRCLPTITTKYTETALHTLCATAAIIADNPDIVHFHAQGPCLFSWLPRLLRPRMKVFFTCHGLDWQRRKWPAWASRFLRLGEWCSVVFPHCRIMVARHLQDYYQTNYQISAVYVPNGIVVHEPPGSAKIATLGLSPRSYVLWVGRIVPEKRLEDVITAYCTAPRPYRLVIVGESADTRGYLERLQTMAGGSDRIMFLGYQYGDTLHQLYANACACIAASELEGLPLTLLEALSFGTVCVASDIPPHREVLAPLPGYLFRTGDTAALARCMHEAVLLDEAVRARYGSAAREMIARGYSWDAAAEELDRLYREAVFGALPTGAD